MTGSNAIPSTKMMIYKIYQLRVIAAATLLALIPFIILVLNPPQKCVQVSVSVRQWRPHNIKRTRAVQALDENIKASSDTYGSKSIISPSFDNAINNGWFRSKLILLPSNDETQDDEDGYEPDEYSEFNENYEVDEYYDEISDNKAFEDGDFDYNETKSASKLLEPDFGLILRMYHTFKNNNRSDYAQPILLTQSSQAKQNVSVSSKNLRKSLRHRWRNITLINVEGVPIVEDGIFWSDELERRTPKGADDQEAQVALKKLRSLSVQKVEPPTWNRCGRPKNQFVVFEDGSKACARYRAPHHYLIQGEVLSFYLSRLLGIHNVPVVSLAAVKPDFAGMWSRQEVKQDLIHSKWEINTTVALIQWIENLERDKMPPTLLSSLAEKSTLSASSSSILRLPAKKLTELLQWSDLIVFDYITGNYDRVASMQDAADKEKKPSILHETIHNLVRSKSTGGLWLIDNESGLLDSYSLLYGATGKDGRFLAFHRQMLETICLFRRSTVERIRWLHKSNRAGSILMELVKQLEPLFMPMKKEKEVSRRLQERIAEVNNHIDNCLSNLS